MAFTLRLDLGSDLTLDRDNLTIIRKFKMEGTLPYTGGGDAFDNAASQVMAYITANYPAYSTPMGVLHWNSIRLDEKFYAQQYDVSVTYSPLNKQTGTYQIQVDQATGTSKIKCGRRIAGYVAAGATGDMVNNGGLILVDPETQQVEGTDVPVAEDRISISYRHPQAYLNAAYIRAVGALRGYPNNDVFLGYEPGEVMYMGGNFTQTEAEASASYSFNISPNATNLVIGTITLTEKKGWDFPSPTFKTEVHDNGTEKHTVKVLKCIETIRPREWKNYRSVFGWG